MSRVYRTLRVAPSGDGVLGVMIDAPPMNLIGPELVRDLVSLLGELESEQETRVVVLERADADSFAPRVDRPKLPDEPAGRARAGRAGRGVGGHVLPQARRPAGRDD